MIEARPGRELVRQGEPCPDAWVVRSGAMLMEALDPDGRRLALDVLGPGDLVGGAEGSTLDATFRSIVPTMLLPAGPISLRNGMARRARRATWVACSIAWQAVSERITARLDDLAERFGRRAHGGLLIPLPLTQEDLAALVGSTRESVNRALADLAARDHVTRVGGRYVVRAGASRRAVSPRIAAS
jgi:CRP/FNR family transcriptional regulator, cyclic AMP receptor protein